MEVIIAKDYEHMSQLAAEIIAAQVRTNQFRSWASPRRHAGWHVSGAGQDV
jgi:hypothetical protein